MILTLIASRLVERMQRPSIKVLTNAFSAARVHRRRPEFRVRPLHQGRQPEELHSVRRHRQQPLQRSVLVASAI
jgi:hypothetical protein